MRPSCILDSFDPVPQNTEAALKLPEAELNSKLVPVFGARFPVVAVANNGKQVVSDDSSATVIVVGAGNEVKFAPLPKKFVAVTELPIDRFVADRLVAVITPAFPSLILLPTST